MKKVTVIGAGFVGATCARRIVERDLADVVLMDIVEGLPQGKALDLMESSPVEGFKAKIIGTNDYSDTKDSDIVVITAGMARKPGMSRDDLQKINAGIISDVVKNVSSLSPDSIIIVVTNPLDVMSYLALKVSGFVSNKVIGMAGILDSSRYRYFVSEKLGVGADQVQTMVLGGHGDTMVPLTRYSTVEGKPITDFLKKEEIDSINERTRKGGSEIVKLLKTGSAYYAPSAAVVEMIKNIFSDINDILPCCVYLNGEYGIKDIYFGVPVRLGSGGVKEIVDLELEPEEEVELLKSAEAVKQGIKKLEKP